MSIIRKLRALIQDRIENYYSIKENLDLDGLYYKQRKLLRQLSSVGYEIAELHKVINDRFEESGYEGGDTPTH